MSITAPSDLSATITTTSGTAPRPGIDVKMGRGESAKQFNAHYRELIALFHTAYVNVRCNMGMKRLLAEEVVQIIYSNQDGRFYDAKGVLMSRHQALEKTQKALKDYKRRNVQSTTRSRRGINAAETTTTQAIPMLQVPPVSPWNSSDESQDASSDEDSTVVSVAASTTISARPPVAQVATSSAAHLFEPLDPNRKTRTNEEGYASFITEQERNILEASLF